MGFNTKVTFNTFQKRNCVFIIHPYMAVVQVRKWVIPEPKPWLFFLNSFKFNCALLHKWKGLLFQPLQPINVTLTTQVVAVMSSLLGRCAPPSLWPSSCSQTVSGLFPDLAWLDLVWLFTGATRYLYPVCNEDVSSFLLAEPESWTLHRRGDLVSIAWVCIKDWLAMAVRGREGHMGSRMQFRDCVVTVWENLQRKIVQFV